MRLLSVLLLTFLLAALCQGRSMRPPRNAVGVPSSEETSLEDSLEDGTDSSIEDDDSSEDPDWLPTNVDDGDYEYSFDYDEGSVRVERQLQTSVQNPDLGATILEDSLEDDDDVNDPDWVPTEEDYEEEDEDYPEYDSIEEDDEGDTQVADALVDALWSSDDDPDWKPTDEDYDESEEAEGDSDEHDDDNEEARVDEVLFDIALLVVERGDLEVPGPDKVLAVFQTLKELDMTYEQALEVLSQLRADGDTSENEIVPVSTQDTQPVAAVIKAKRQVKSHRFSQATQDINPDRYGVQPIQAIGEIQQSPPDQYNTGDVNSPSYGSIEDQGPWGSGQINQASEIQPIGSVNQASQPNQQDIAAGVEPVYPQNVNPSEVGAGVVPLDRDADSTGSSVIGWFQRGWEHVVDTADKVGDHVEDTFSGWGDAISGAVDNAQDAASHAVDAARDAAQSAGESIVNTYHKVKGKIPELLERIRSLFTRFGVLVQTGAEYYIQKMEDAVDKVRQAEILDKLQQKLAEGNEQVTAFFQLLGQKASTWTQTHGHENVDAGLITIQQVHPEEGVVEEDVVSVGGEQSMPNWFQDEEVIEQLNQMMDAGIITQSDLDLLSQQKQEEAQLGSQQQSQQQNQEQGSSPVIQIQSGGSRSYRRRSLRALIDALKAR